MSINANPFNCDICTRAKQETNHWLLGCAIDTKGQALGTYRAGTIIVGYKIIQWSEGNPNLPGVAHLCGLECASKWIMKKLSELQQIPSPSLGDTEEKH